MTPRSSGKPRDDFEAKATFADDQADLAPTRQVAERWRHIAKTYRWIGYYRLAFGKWQPPAADEPVTVPLNVS